MYENGEKVYTVFLPNLFRGQGLGPLPPASRATEPDAHSMSAHTEGRQVESEETAQQAADSFGLLPLLLHQPAAGLRKGAVATVPLECEPLSR
eukprot:COSAG06_NODE_7841_length_2358_cov_1.149624_1_plen_93_part_10